VDRLRPSDDEDFWNIMREAKNADINPPTSFADLFMSVYRERLPRPSCLYPFRLQRFGGWQSVVREHLQAGEFHGRVFHYDINRAYRWAALQGLPDVRSAYWTCDVNAPYAVYLARVKPDRIPYHQGAGLTMITSEERDAFQLHDAMWPLYGLAFRNSVSLADAFAKIDTRFPTSTKRIGRSFWGMWNTREAPEQLSWKHGERVREMKNPFFNPIWSAFITSRIKIKLASVYEHALHIYVDAIHSTVELPTGTADGDWRLDGIYDRAWFRSPGYWGEGPCTIRHSGRASLSEVAGSSEPDLQYA